MYVRIYIYIYIYNCGPIFTVQGSKVRSPQIVPGEKNGFGSVPVSEVSFFCLRDAQIEVWRPSREVLGWFSGAPRPLKTWIPCSTSVKNQDFKVFACKTILEGTFEASWSSWKRLWSLLGSYFGALLATLTGVPVSNIWFFCAPGDVGVFSRFRMVSRVPFGWYLEPLLVVRACPF